MPIQILLRIRRFPSFSYACGFSFPAAFSYTAIVKDGYFLFLARIVPEKGLHYLIEAFSELETDKKLVIAGGSSQAMDYMERIHRMAAEDERILMTDFVQGQVLEELYANAYAFVLPSDVEGMALTLLEAMSYASFFRPYFSSITAAPCGFGRLIPFGI